MDKKKSKHHSGLVPQSTVVYLRTFRQKKLFRVLDLQSGKTSFVGTKAECRRYLQVLTEKINRHRNRRLFKPSPVTRLYCLSPPASLEAGG